MANKLLYPRNSATRRLIDMDGLWKFEFDWDNQGDKENWKEGLKDATSLPVPASNKKGIFTRDRQPKMAAFLLKKRWESLPLDYKRSL